MVEQQTEKDAANGLQPDGPEEIGIILLIPALSGVCSQALTAQ